MFYQFGKQITHTLPLNYNLQHRSVIFQEQYQLWDTRIEHSR